MLASNITNGLGFKSTLLLPYENGRHRDPADVTTVIPVVKGRAGPSTRKKGLLPGRGNLVMRPPRWQQPAALAGHEQGPTSAGLRWRSGFSPHWWAQLTATFSSPYFTQKLFGAGLLFIFSSPPRFSLKK